MFVDQVNITLYGGKGGNGCVSFRREKGVPKGGPDGGYGGDGGNIYFVSDKSIKSLAYFRYHPIIRAKKGAHGEGKNRRGKKGDDLYLNVPVGTVVREKDKEKIAFDFVSDGQKFLASKGGKGGRGNASFVTSTNQAPRERREGQPGEGKTYTLELKLLADVGLIGFPNVGKSTLISKISDAKPKIANYPFTTLIPNLGVVDIDEFRSFVVADIPGLIKGAHQGHGLGIQFLKHIERTKILVHLIDVSPYSDIDPIQAYDTVIKELKEFKASLAGRRQILVANKIDLLHENKSRLEKVKEIAKKRNIPFFTISALKREGLKPLVSEMIKTLNSMESETDPYD
ncbi:MAG: GTPase ObgE [Candidatus Aminicenantaceae bacterium]